MRTLQRTARLASFVTLLGLGSCSLHAGLSATGYRTGDESFAVGFGISVLALALLMYRRWYWSKEANSSAFSLHSSAIRPGLDGELVLSEPQMLAEFPVALWADKKEPFKTWRSPGLQVRADIEDVLKMASHAHLFLMYHATVYEQFGPAVAARVRTEQIKRVDRLGNQTGHKLFALVDEIQRVMILATSTPMKLPGRPDVEVPVTYPVALSLLTTWRDSPYFIDQHERAAGSMPNLNGDEFALAECLTHCGVVGSNYFTRFLSSVTIDARILAKWANDETI